MKRYRKSFFANELYSEKLNMIKRENNITTTTDCFKLLIDYYIKNSNQKNLDKSSDNKISNEEILQELKHLKQKINGIDFNTLVELHMLSDISDSNQVTERYMVPLEQTVNQHYEKAYEHARHYLANRREF
ncbi:hypothetical protein O3668_11440 [Staphylococcus capitis]|uniref:hypothetical protein n=1 Tax=Staphylococcus capitis TaxID=29388 RepID=UPI00352D145C